MIGKIELIAYKPLKEFIMKKTKTYMDKLMENKKFREKFNKEYQNLCIGENISGICHRINLIQDTLIKRAKYNKL